MKSKTIGFIVLFVAVALLGGSAIYGAFGHHNEPSKPGPVMSETEYRVFVDLRTKKESADFLAQKVLLDTNKHIEKLCSDRAIPTAECVINIGTRTVARAQPKSAQNLPEPNPGRVATAK